MANKDSNEIKEDLVLPTKSFLESFKLIALSKIALPKNLNYKKELRKIKDERFKKKYNL